MSWWFLIPEYYKWSQLPCQMHHEGLCHTLPTYVYLLWEGKMNTRVGRVDLVVILQTYVSLYYLVWTQSNLHHCCGLGAFNYFDTTLKHSHHRAKAVHHCLVSPFRLSLQDALDKISASLHQREAYSQENCSTIWGPFRNRRVLPMNLDETIAIQEAYPISDGTRDWSFRRLFTARWFSISRFKTTKAAGPQTRWMISEREGDDTRRSHQPNRTLFTQSLGSSSGSSLTFEGIEMNLNLLALDFQRFRSILGTIGWSIGHAESGLRQAQNLGVPASFWRKPEITFLLCAEILNIV